MTDFYTNGEGFDSKLGTGYYETDFYSGSNIQVMVGDVLVDNAVAINYSVQQSKTPIYGYASQYFSFVAMGQVLVTGSLTIAFKESGYLLYTLKRFAETQGGDVRFLNKSGTWGVGGSNFQSLKEASGAAKAGRVRFSNIEQMMQSRNPVQQATLVKQLHALSDKAFEDLAEEFEDAIWYGSGRGNPNTRADLFSRNLEGSVSEEDILSHRRVDQYPSVDIWITYGDMEAPDGVNHTVQKILDVHFTGETKTIQADDSPVYETYFFIARNRV